MDKRLVVEKLCRFARDVASSGASAVEHMRSTHYGEFRGTISPTELEQYLLEHPDLVQDWVGFSADNRSASGWYLRDPGSAHSSKAEWKGGFYPSGDVHLFYTGTEACAAFILEYAEQVLSHS